MNGVERASGNAAGPAGKKPARPAARRLARTLDRLSTRLSEAALAGILALVLALPSPPPPLAGSERAGPAADAIAVRRVPLQPVAVKATMKVAAAPDRPPAAAPPAPAESKPASAAPLPVPPSSAPREQLPDKWSDKEIAEAKALCTATLKALTVTGEVGEPIRNGACGTPAPLSVKRIGSSAAVELQPAATINCRLASALDRWITDTLQPAARASFQSPVTRILVASSYTCRNRYGQSDAPISEHAFANALDISGFVLADGRTILVRDAWGPTARDNPAAQPLPADAKETVKTAPASKPGKPAAAPLPMPISASTAGGQPANDAGLFLRELHKVSCATFGTVLGPEANEAHRDHLHVDLKERKHAHVCQ